MTSFGTMHRQQQQYGQQYIDKSNPSSTHSSPRTYPSDLEPYYPTHHQPHLTHSQTYPIPAGVAVNPYNPVSQQRRGGSGNGTPSVYPSMQPSRSASYSSYSTTAPVSLQVSTSTSSVVQEHDPNERTARPGNAHVHAQFHSSLASVPSLPGSGSLGSNPAASASSTSLHSSHNGVNGGDDAGMPTQDASSSLSSLALQGLTRPLKPVEQERLAHLDRLKFFLATAPARWDSSQPPAGMPPTGMGMPPNVLGSGMPGSGATDEFAFPSYAAGAGAPGGGSSFASLEASYHHAPPHPALNRYVLR